MNEKAFTLVELIAVVVIMAIIMVIATPNIVNMLDKGKKEDYVADAKNFISKATYEYRKNEDNICKGTDGSDTEENQEANSNNKCIIFLKNLGISEEDQKDPYGLKYDLDNSKIIFSTEEDSSSSQLPKRQVSIILISHSDNNNNNTCYVINNVQKTVLNKDSVKKGIYSNDTCTISQEY